MQEKKPVPKKDEITDPIFLKLKEDLSRAKYFVEHNDQEKAVKYAKSAFTQEINKKSYLKAIDICKEFRLLDSDIKAAATGLFTVRLENKNYEEALDVIEQYKLTAKELPDIALAVFKKNLKADNLDKARSIKNKYDIKKDKFLPIVTEMFNSFMSKGMLNVGETLIKDYQLQVQEAAEGFINIFKWFVRNKKYEEAIRIKQKYTIPKTQETQKAATTVFNQLILIKNFEHANVWIKEFGIPTEEIQGIVIYLIVQKLKINSIDEAIELKNQFKPPESILLEPAYKSFEKVLFKEDINLAKKIYEDFKIPDEKIVPVTAKVFTLKMHGGNYDIAADIAKEFKIPEDVVTPAATKVFDLNVIRGNYKRALILKEEFKIPEENVINNVLRAFENKINQNNFNVAKMILNNFKLPKEKVNFIISKIVESFVNKNLLQRAVYLGNFFDLPKSNVEKLEWKLFNRKMENGQYADAYTLAMEYNLSTEMVSERVKYYTKLLEERGAKSSADLIRQDFKMTKKGFFSKLFG